MSVTAPTGVTNEKDEQKDYQYELDVKVDDSTIKKSEGKLTVGNVPAAQVTVDKTAAGITSTDAQAAFKELKEKIDKVDNAAKSYAIVKVTEGLGANVKEQYNLQQTVNGVTSFEGEPINIYKDGSLDSVELVNQELVFKYNLATGEQSVIRVDVSTFLAESEFADGLQVTDHVVSVKLGQGLEFGNEAKNKSIKVKIDSASESFLTLGDEGVKLAGVQAAIDEKVAALDVTDAAVEGQYVSQVSETDGKIAVSRLNVSDAVLNGYAKGEKPASTAIAAKDDVKGALAKLEHQVDEAKAATTAAIEALNKGDTAAEGQVVTAVPTANGIAQPTKANFADIKLGGFAQDASATGKIASTDTLAAALNKLENKIDAAADDHTVVEHATNNTHVTVSGTPNGNGGTTYTVTENDIASAQALTNEIKRAQDAENEIADKVGLTGDEGKRTFTPTTNYGAGSTSVVGNMEKLDAKLKEVADSLAAVQYQVNGTTLEFSGISPKTV